jgi:hypothetical protein
MKHCTCAATAAVMIIVACQPDRQGSAIPALDSPGVAEAANDSLRLAMELPARVRAGEVVAIMLHARNVSGRALELYLQGREPTADVLVHTSSHELVWHRLAGLSVQAILRLEPLAPDESLTVHVTWDQRGDDGIPVPPGVYQITARVLAEGDGALSFPPAWVEILP